MRTIKSLALITLSAFLVACSSGGMNSIGDATTSKFVGKWMAVDPCDDGSVVTEVLDAKPGLVPLTFTVQYSSKRVFKDGRVTRAYGLMRGESTFNGVTFVDTTAANGTQRLELTSAGATYIDDNTMQLTSNGKGKNKASPFYCSTLTAQLKRVLPAGAAK